MVQLLDSPHSENHQLEDFTEEEFAPLWKRHRSTVSIGSSSQWGFLNDVFTSQSPQFSDFSQAPQFSQSPEFSDFSPSPQVSQSTEVAPVDDELGPLGLRLRKTPSLLDMIQMRLRKNQKSSKNEETGTSSRGKKSSKGNASSNANDKLKASNFPASLLRIGNWEYVSKYEGDLVAKCYFAKHKLVWEVLDGGLKSKIEMQWSDIVALKADCSDENPCTLTIVLAREPVFYRETNPQPRKHTLWQASSDFTEGQATINRIHYLECPPGMLTKHYEKLIQCDTRLGILSQQPDRVICSPLFESQTLVENPEDSSRGNLLNQLTAAKGKTSPPIPAAAVGDFGQPSSFSLGSNLMAAQYTPNEVPLSSFVMDPNGYGGSEKLKGPRNLETLVARGLPRSNGSDRLNQLPVTMLGSPSSAFDNSPSARAVQFPSLHSGHNPVATQGVYRDMSSPTIQGNINIDEGQKSWERLMAPRQLQFNGADGCNQLPTTMTGTPGSVFENPFSGGRTMQSHPSNLGHKPIAAQGMSRGVPLPNSVTIQGNKNFDTWQQSSEPMVIPGLNHSGSISNLLDHVEECIALNKASGNYPLVKASEDMLDSITDALLSDTQQTTGLDEGSLMKKVNSLCCLLDIPNPASGSSAGHHAEIFNHGHQNVFPDLIDEQSNEKANNFKWDSEWGFADGPSNKMETGLQRKDSYVEMLYNLPRIASLPKFAVCSSKGY